MSNVMKMYPESEVTDMFWSSWSKNFTYDQAFLRYEGPIPVFMYGWYTNFLWLERLVKENWTSKIPYRIGIDMKSYSNGEQKTKETLRYYNVANYQSKNALLQHPSFMLGNDVQLKGSTAARKQIQGRMFTFSLRAIKALDRYMSNGLTFTRELIELEAPHKGDWELAYTYFIKPARIAFAVDDGAYSLKEGIDLTHPTKVISTEGRQSYYL